MSICIVTPVKLEEKYLDEWIKYNIYIGFDHIYLYDNNDDPSLLSTCLQDCEFRDRVTVNSMPGAYPLQHGFRHWMENYKHLYKAVGFFDPDEFIVLHKHANMKHLLEEVLYSSKSGALGINWVLFGDNVHTLYSPEPVTKRFTRRDALANHHIKSIVVCDDLVGMENPHSPHLVPGKYQVDTSGKTFMGPFNHNGPIDVCQMNHYFCKTLQEWTVKRNKGRADISPTSLRGYSEFDDHNKNDIEDDRAWQFYSTKMKLRHQHE